MLPEFLVFMHWRDVVAVDERIRDLITRTLWLVVHLDVALIDERLCGLVTRTLQLINSSDIVIVDVWYHRSVILFSHGVGHCLRVSALPLAAAFS